MEIKPTQVQDLQGGTLINVGAITPVTGSSLSQPGVGTAYSLTNTNAQIAFGTTNPTITIPTAGTYKITGRVQVETAAATLTTQTAKFTFYRTNNTPGAVGTLLTFTLVPMTTTTQGIGILQLPELIYTAAAGDILSIWGQLSASAGAGNVNVIAIGTLISANRVA